MHSTRGLCRGRILDVLTSMISWTAPLTSGLVGAGLIGPASNPPTSSAANGARPRGVRPRGTAVALLVRARRTCGTPGERCSPFPAPRHSRARLRPRPRPPPPPPHVRPAAGTTWFGACGRGGRCKSVSSSTVQLRYRRVRQKACMEAMPRTISALAEGLSSPSFSKELLAICISLRGCN